MAEPSATLAAIGGLITALTGLVAAITALVRAIRTRPNGNHNGSGQQQQ